MPISPAGTSPSGSVWPDDAGPSGAAPSLFTPKSASGPIGSEQTVRRSDQLAAPGPLFTKKPAEAGPAADGGPASASASTKPADLPSRPGPMFTKKAELPDDATRSERAAEPVTGSGSVFTPDAGPGPAGTGPAATGSAAWSADPPSPLGSTAEAWTADATKPLSSAGPAWTPGSLAEAASARRAGDPQSGIPQSGIPQSDNPQSGELQPADPAGPSWSLASLGLAGPASATETPGTPPVAATSGPPSTGGPGDWGGSGGSGGWGSGPAGPPAPPQQNPRRRLVPLVGIAAAVAVLVAGGGAYLYLQKSSPAQAAGSGPAKNASPAAKGPEHVVSVTPADGTAGVNGAANISVLFSEPLSPTSPMPTLKPAIGGTWQRHGSTAVFVPARGFSPRTKVTVTVPGGSAGVQSTGGGLLASPVTATFRTSKLSNVRIEQLLAQLGYLPLTWAPTTGAAVPLTDAHAQLSAAYSPPAGTYTWQSGYPSALKRLWRPDKPSQVLQGAVMAFQADHKLTSDLIYENQQGLTLNGSIGHRLWKALFRAIGRGATNKHGYTYALASQKAPETLTVWHNGARIFRHLANTGIPVSPTAVRTDPVYIRYQSQIMKGTNPDGTKYADPVAWVAYFHSGEAVHYFPRYSYGSQQSLGCVELPWGPAKKIWPYLTYGTLVTVTAP